MHKFVVNGSRFLFDENTNSLHEIDQLVWDLLDTEGIDESDALQRLGDRYPIDEIRTALAELEELREAGLIFSPPMPRPDVPIADPPWLRLSVCIWPMTVTCAASIASLEQGRLAVRGS